ncbi:MAG TPA: MFS transporter [Phenylobacterium sp.]|uniref:MFS transporter n=1 Tax=Phenylobacterium sp. TaxID=1871053 RepID=UPI002B482A43|nr:MFS transporter [Phenylobacterium sp.]HKR88418.1 MFS transporter [Phenylobacterium sp.]
MAQLPLKASAAGLRGVVISSAAGTAFEWYDFFVFGSLASILSRQFTAGDPTAGFIFTLGAFAAGFLVRPFGAMFFGRMGDLHGRKIAFLTTITLMGLATIGIGLLPTAEAAGPMAAVLLVCARVVQGFAMGGEYGGAAVYVAEYAPPKHRGFLTSWIQTAAAAGLLCALAVVLAARSLVGEEAFGAWGWRIPFLFSSLLLLISLRVRARLEESPVFSAMKARQGLAKAPLAEAFRGPNLRTMLIALFAILLAQGAIWYAMHFYVQFFLERVVKLPGVTVNVLMASAVVASSGLYVVFGALSDRVGRRPVMLGGMVVALVCMYPGFRMLTAFGNPGLVVAAARAPIVVAADPENCGLAFDLLGRRNGESSCDVVKRALAEAGAPYRNVTAPAGAATTVSVGQHRIEGRALVGLSAEAAMREQARFAAELRRGLAAAGYPLAANPNEINETGLFVVILLLIACSAALYGPQAAALVELFPASIRYTAFSIPYNVGTGWVGGFLPITAFAIVVSTGNLYAGLLYPAAFTVVSIVAMLLFLPETRARPLS